MSTRSLRVPVCAEHQHPGLLFPSVAVLPCSQCRTRHIYPLAAGAFETRHGDSMDDPCVPVPHALLCLHAMADLL